MKKYVDADPVNTVINCRVMMYKDKKGKNAIEDFCLDYYVMGLKHAQQIMNLDAFATHWIPVNEKLPDKNQKALCTIQSGEHITVALCTFNQKTKKWLPDTQGNHDNVIAWFPLPEPFKDMRGET